MERYYSSGGIQGRTPIGRNWRLSCDSRVVQDSATWVTVVRPKGVWLAFRLVNGEFRPDADIADRLQALTDAGGVLTGWRFHGAGSEEVEEYDAGGRLLRITSLHGRVRSFGYDSAGRLASITDGYGRQLLLAYDASSRLSTLTDPGGGVVSYAYDALDRLVSVTYPGGAVRGYLYNELAHASGARGLRAVALQNLRKAAYAKDKLAKVPGCAVRFRGPTFNEFVLRTTKKPATLLAQLRRQQILGGVALGRWYPELADCLLVCVTEQKSRADIDALTPVLGGGR